MPFLSDAYNAALFEEDPHYRQAHVEMQTKNRGGPLRQPRITEEAAAPSSRQSMTETVVMKFRSDPAVKDGVMTSGGSEFGLVQFGQVLRRLRQERRLTQEELAEAAGVSPRYVALIEAGARNPTLNVVLELAVALDIPPYKLFKP